MKRRLLSAILCLALILSMAVTLFACKGQVNDEFTIYASVIDKGYGTEWVEELLKQFFATDAKYAGYKVEIIKSYNDDTTRTQVEQGGDYCNYDLVVHGGGVDFIKDSILYDLTDKELSKEIIRNEADEKVLIGLDYFDASINRLCAWVTGVRSMQKGLLNAMLQPYNELKQLQNELKCFSKIKNISKPRNLFLPAE